MNWDSLLSSLKQICHLDSGMFSLMKNRAIPDMLRSLQMVALPFGTSVSSEIFQKKLLEAFYGLTGVVCVADDVIIHGKTLEDHNKHLNAFFGRCKEKNIKQNKEKLVSRSDSITFMRHKIT